MGWFDWLRRGAPAASDEMRAWREAWAAAVDRAPDAATARSLGTRLEQSGLSEDELEVEREMLDGYSALCDLAAYVERQGLPVVETGHRIVAGDRCHFTAPVSMPDDGSQPSGRLLITERRAIFAGPGSVTVAWHTIANVLRAERDILLVARGRDRLYRFRCNSYAEALTGACIARHLTRPASSTKGDP